MCDQPCIWAPDERVKRRSLLAMLCAAGLLSAPVLGQGQRKKRRIGYFGVLPPDSPRVSASLAALREDLGRHGLVEGKDFSLEYLWEERIDRVPDRMRKLVESGVDLVIAITTPVALAAAQATRTIPIVFGTVSDPVESKLVNSLARPGRNLTGVTNVLPELSGKLLELARDIAPGLKRIAVMWNPDNSAKAFEFRELQAAAGRTGVEIVALPVRSAEQIVRAFSGLRTGEVGALVTLAETLTYANRERIAQLALAKRVPSVFSHTEHVRAGGLLSYSPDYQTLGRRMGDLAGRILSGANPALLPVEQPTIFELAVNLRTARALNIKIPQVILLRADEVIE